MNEILLDLEETAILEMCQGAVFRANVSNCLTKSGFGFFVRLNKIKKLSCPGCNKCGWQDDNFAEVNNDWPIINIEKAEHGKLYTIGICNESRDWESGVIDQWDLELIPYKWNTE